ncbi:DUF2231 domain-containing protein [Pseudonocardia saturnea]
MSTVAGLPLHPLVVHAVVVLLPLAAIGTLAVAVRPAWRRSLGIPTLLVALAGTVAVPLATSSGRQLVASMGGGDPLVYEHAARAGALLPMAVLHVVLLAGAVLVERTALVPSGVGAMGGSPGTDRSRIATVLAALAALAGVVTAALVVQIGHTGAVSVWS